MEILELSSHVNKIKTDFFFHLFLILLRSGLSSIFSLEINVRDAQNVAVYVAQKARVRVVAVDTS